MTNKKETKVLRSTKKEEIEEKDKKDKKDKDSVYKELTVTLSAPLLSSKVRPALYSFDKWFAARGKLKNWKPHWKNGMKAFADTSNRKSMDDWDSIFKDY